MGKPMKELRTRLDEMGVAWVAIGESMTEYMQESIVYRVYEVCDGLQVAIVTPVTTEQAIAATVGRSCASCPEMSNPDSYISHIHAALEWHDEHVPRPTNPRNTCVVLEGEKMPEEVLFIGDNGVTHYLPEATCHLEECEHEREVPYDLPDCDGGWYTEVTYDCDECGYENTDPNIRFCGGCGRKVVTE